MLQYSCSVVTGCTVSIVWICEQHCSSLLNTWRWAFSRGVRKIPQAGLGVNSVVLSCDHGPLHSVSAGRIGVLSLLHHAIFMATKTEVWVQVQVYLLVVKADVWNKTCHYFAYKSNSFLGDYNRGTSASTCDLADIHGLFSKQTCKAKRSIILFT